MPLHVSSTLCSSSGGQTCIIQSLASSHQLHKLLTKRLTGDAMYYWGSNFGKGSRNKAADSKTDHFQLRRC